MRLFDEKKTKKKKEKSNKITKYIMNSLIFRSLILIVTFKSSYFQLRHNNPITKRRNRHDNRILLFLYFI